VGGVEGAMSERTRYQDCGWLRRLWRRRWMLLVPWSAVRVYWHEITRPPRYVRWHGNGPLVKNPDGTFWKAPRMPFSECWGLARSMAEARMEWFYTLDEVHGGRP